MCVCVCVRARVRAHVRVRTWVCVRATHACACVCVYILFSLLRNSFLHPSGLCVLSPPVENDLWTLELVQIRATRSGLQNVRVQHTPIGCSGGPVPVA